MSDIGKLTIGILVAMQLIPAVAFAAPVSWDGTAPSLLQPLRAFWSALVKADRFQATSTIQASTFPYASTTVVSATGVCLTGDLPCRTTWPTGSAFPFTPTTNFAALTNATNTPLWFQQGFQASSTIRFGTSTPIFTLDHLTGDLTYDSPRGGSFALYVNNQVAGITGNSDGEVAIAGSVVTLIGNTELALRGAGANAAVLNTASLSAPRTFTFPDADGTFCLTTACAFPFTAQSWGNSTTSTIGFYNGIISTASSTFSSLGTGSVAVNNGRLYNTATTTYSSGLTYLNGNVTNTGVTSIVAGNGISVSGATGAVTVTNAYGYPFAPISGWVTPTNSTSTLIGFTGGLFSTAATSTIFNLNTINSTSTNATTTTLNISGQLDIDQMTSALLLTGSTGIVAEYAGSSCTGNVVQAISALGAVTCAGFSAFPFTPTTNYNANSNATSTPIWLRAQPDSIFASSTANFERIVVGTTTTGAFATSTFGGNITVAGIASTSRLTISLLNAANCDLKADTNGNVSCGTDAQGSAAFPFVPTVSFGTTTSATTTPIWGQTGIFASSTSRFHEVQIGTSSPAGNTNAPLIVTGNVNSYTQAIVQNLSNTSNASACFVTGNASSTDTKYYGEFCINSNAYTQAAFTSQNPGDSSLLSSDGGLVISTASSTNPFADIRFTTGGTSSSTIRAIFTAAGFIGIGTTTPKFASLQIGSSTAPQLILSDNTNLTSDWAFRAFGGGLYLSTTTAAGTATSTFSTLYIDSNGRMIATQMASSSLRLSGVISPGIEPSLYYATSTAWTGTTTLPVESTILPKTFRGISCFTDVGTLNVNLYSTSTISGTLQIRPLSASTTNNFNEFTQNNVFGFGSKVRVDIGTPASSPTKITCTFLKVLN